MTTHQAGRLLNERELRVLAASRLDSRMAVSALAKATGLQPHTIHRTLRSLRERGIIQPFLLINPHLLGLNDFCLFFNLHQSTSQTRNRVIAALKASPHVAYFGELAGEFQYTVSIFSSSILAVESVLRDLAELHPDGSVESTFALRLDWTILSSPVVRGKRRVSISRPAVDARVKIDQLDRNFLYHFSRSPDASLLRLAQKLGVSEGTVRTRLAKLLESGVLLGIPYLVNWSRAGLYPMRAMISLHGSELLNHGTCDQKIRGDGEISEYVRCLGGWEVECNFNVASPPAAGEFVQRLHGHFEGRVRQLRCASEIGTHVMHRLPESLLASPE